MANPNSVPSKQQQEQKNDENQVLHTPAGEMPDTERKPGKIQQKDSEETFKQGQKDEQKKSA